MPKRRTERNLKFRGETLESRTLLNADPIISEFMARNSGTFLDGDGNSSDWIEIHNRGDEDLALTDWYLTDDQDRLTRWKFPETSLAAGERLVVFASGQTADKYVDVEGHLHTNFKLGGDGEFLALVEPDGQTITSHFSPRFPEQIQDVSYGLEFGATLTEPLVDSQSPARILIPAGSVDDWNAPNFDDAGWIGNDTELTSAIGFEFLDEVELPPGLVTHFSFDETNPSATAFESVSELNYDIIGSSHFMDGQFSNALRFDGSTIIDFDRLPDGLTDGFSLLGWIQPQARNRTIMSGLSANLKSGFWFGYNNDGPWLGIAAGASTAENGIGRWKNVTAENTITDLGSWHHVVATFDPTDTAEEVKFYLNGSQLTTDVSGADLPDGFMGDPGNSDFRIGLHNLGAFPFEGGMDDIGVFDRPLSEAEIKAFADRGVVSGGPVLDRVIETDLLEPMRGQNSSAFVRIPFVVENAARFNALKLDMQYNDGFVAYLNGTEIVRRNAPEDLRWNATATDQRSADESLVVREFDVSDHVSLLASGQNVLALHALNSAADDSTFLVIPKLSASQITERVAYFPEPTPGEANNRGYQSFVEDTRFSVDRGFFQNPFSVALSTSTAGAQIRFTLDGSPPTATTGIPYDSPIPIETTTTLRAAAFLDDYLPTNVGTHTYIFPEDVIRQPKSPSGFPPTWDRYNIGPTGAPVPADYEMNQAIINTHADTIIDDLKSLPTMSIVMDNEDLFGSDGIYTHPFIDPEIRERATSIEWFQADGAREFQIDAGIRLFGGWSKHFWATPKKGFALKFKRPYGPTKLDFPLFSENQVDSKIEGTSEFDTVLLRGVFSDAWPDAASPPQYLRDLNTRYMQLAMGQLASHGTWVHLYLNGLYWGIYNPSERPDASFLASYLGGDRTEYDTVKHRGLCGPGCASNDSYEVVDGGQEADAGYRAALNAARKNLRDSDNYAAFTALVDVENLIDYILLEHYVGNVDWPHKNWYANRKREGGDGWKFYVWDSEYTLRSTSDSRLDASNPNTPAFLYSRARQNPEFRRLFGDRVQKHLFNDGALQPERNIERYRQLASHIEDGIKLEAARWGDNGATRKGRTNFDFDDWTRVRDSIITRYFPRRHSIAIRQLRQAGLFPDIDAPNFSQFGGAVDQGFALEITASQGQIFVTMDGSDPIDSNRQYTAPIPLNDNVVVKARALHEGEWSALTEAAFFAHDGRFDAGDFNNDGQINVRDITLLCQEIGSPGVDRRFDLNDDGSVDVSDRDTLIADILGTGYGDANLDGVFNSRDFVDVFRAGQFEDRIEDNSSWSEGDWNCDGDFTSSDLVLAFQKGSYTVAARSNREIAAAMAVSVDLAVKSDDFLDSSNQEN